MIKKIINKIRYKKQLRESRKQKIQLFLTVSSLGRDKLMNDNLLPYDEVKCVTSTLDEAVEFVDIKIYNSLKEPYEKWCLAEGLDDTLRESWDEFIQTQVGDKLQDYFSQYTVVPFTYSASDFARFMRAFIKYKNIGCSFEGKPIQLSNQPKEEEEDIFEYCKKKEEVE